MTSTDVNVDAGDDITLSGVDAAKVEMATVQVTTASGLTAEVGTETSVVSQALKVDVVSDTKVSTADMALEASGTMSVSGQESLTVSAGTVALDAAQDGTLQLRLKHSGIQGVQDVSTCAAGC